MKTKIIAFFDVLLYSIICGPMVIASIFLMHILLENGTNEWLYKNMLTVICFAIFTVLPLVGWILIRHCTIGFDSIYFFYFPFTISWDKAFNNIDFLWNQKTICSEIHSIKIVKLSKKERKNNVFYKHIFNKYLRIELKSKKIKYVYIGNYSRFQINKIIKLISNNH